MTKRKIDMRSEVTVRITRRDAAEIIFDAINESSSLKIEWNQNADVTRKFKLPLWELMKIFGPHITTSVMLPFIEIEFEDNDNLGTPIAWK